MTEDSIKKILSALLEKTKKGQVNWFSSTSFGMDSSGPDDFAFSMPDYTVNIYEVQDDFYFAIFDSEGNQTYHKKLDTREEVDLMVDLLKLAAYKAGNVDNLLRDILETLETDKTLGTSKPIDPNAIPF